MKKKKVLLIVVVILVLIGMLMNCGNDDTSKDNEVSEENKVEEEVKEKEVLYEGDEVLNDFFVKYQELSNTEFKDYSFTKTKEYKCSVENSGYWFDVAHHHNSVNGDITLDIRINETNETADAGVPAMREVYYYTVKALDNSLSDDDIYNVFDNREEDKGEHILNNISILITPDLELSGGHSRGHIDITKLLEE